jgi:hypothetical protein
MEASFYQREIRLLLQSRDVRERHPCILVILNGAKNLAPRVLCLFQGSQD